MSTIPPISTTKWIITSKQWWSTIPPISTTKWIITSKQWCQQFHQYQQNEQSALTFTHCRMSQGIHWIQKLVRMSFGLNNQIKYINWILFQLWPLYQVKTTNCHSLEINLSGIYFSYYKLFTYTYQYTYIHRGIVLLSTSVCESQWQLLTLDDSFLLDNGEHNSLATNW